MTIIEIILLYLQTGTTARFDFEGNLVTSDEGIDVKLGLHHHGNEPEVRQHRCFLHTSLLTMKKNLYSNFIRLCYIFLLSSILTQFESGTLLCVEGWLLSGGAIPSM